MKVLFRDERSHERVVIVRIADDQLLRAVDEAFDENVVDGFVDENPVDEVETFSWFFRSKITHDFRFHQTRLLQPTKFPT